MKKYLAITLGLLFILLGVLDANATLLGIRDNYTGVRPDMDFDGSGTITYTHSTDLFTLTALDNKIIWPTIPSSEDYLLPKVGLGLAISVDGSGNLTGGVSNYTYTWTVGGTNYSVTSNYDMIEYVLTDVVIKGKTYPAGTILLEGEITGFGWDNVSPYNEFDFLFAEPPISGALVTDGLWPQLPTGMYALTGQWSGDWTQSFSTSTTKGDKMPVPEPGTLMLLGSGLIGIGAYGWRKMRRK